jgi:hypothetical protein
LRNFIDQAVLAIYFPIIVFSATACFLYLANVLIPAIRSKTFRFERHAVALTAVSALLAHLTESSYYSFVRIINSAHEFMNFLPFIAPMKLIILFSSILAVAVYNKAVFGAQNLLKLNLIALAVWLVSFVALVFLND